MHEVDILTGGVARRANPTPKLAGQRVQLALDNVGRQLTTPFQVRDLVKTGYATLALSQETTLISAVVGAYLDIVSITASNKKRRRY